MKREILFRGKRADNGEWVEGDLIHRQVLSNICIANQELTRSVIPETVGQFTGLTDKNGVKIFEGDILNDSQFNCIVVWNNASWQIKYRFEQYPEEIDLHFVKYAIIGNIHENPELV